MTVVFQIIATGLCYVDESYIGAMVSGYSALFTYVFAKKIRKEIGI